MSDQLRDAIVAVMVGAETLNVGGQPYIHEMAAALLAQFDIRPREFDVRDHSAPQPDFTAREDQAFADSIADYLATRTKPWENEAEMREAVHDALRLTFTEALDDPKNPIQAVLDRRGARVGGVYDHPQPAEGHENS